MQLIKQKNLTFGRKLMVWCLSFLLITLCLPVLAARSKSALSNKDDVSIISKGLKAEHWETPGGVKVFFVRMHNLPILDVRALFYAGSARDGDDHGLAMLTNSTMLEATKKQNADQLRDSLDGLGSQLSAQVGRQVAQVDLRCLTYSDYMQPSLNIMRNLLGDPAFAVRDMHRVKRQMRAALKAYDQSPSDVALNTMFNTLYNGQPYAHRPFGDDASIKSTTKQQLLAFYKKYYVTGNARLIIVGDITLSQAKKIAIKTTSLLPKGPAAKVLPVAKRLSRGKKVQKDFPSTQTHILMAQIGLDYHDKGFYPFMVGNYILGGSGLNSLLFNFIRNEHGLAYSVNSFFVPTSYRGIFVVNMQTRNQQAKKALRLARNFVNSYVKKGPSDDQVAKAIVSLSVQKKMNLISHRDVLNALTTIATYNLPLNYYSSQQEKLAAVAPRQVRKALRRLIKPNAWAVVTVGGSPVAGEKHEVMPGAKAPANKTSTNKTSTNKITPSQASSNKTSTNKITPSQAS
jgi:zinc protease